MNAPPSSPARRQFVGAAWFWLDVLVPFAISRAVLLLAAWFGRYFPREPRYPDAEALARGWAFVPWRALDVWGRWDTSYYLRIAQDGYPTGGGPELAFFPGYPALLRAAASAWGAPPSTRALFVSAVAVSNVAAIAALALLYRLARERLGDDAAAARSVAYLLAFPSALFLSCAYSESLFLLLAVGAFAAGLSGRWWLAGVAGFGAALTRPVGVLLVPPLAWTYLEAVDWDLRRVRRDALWLLLVPAGIASYALYGWKITGNPGAVFQVQAGWGRPLSWPWTTLTRPRGFHGYLTRIDGTLTITFAALGAWGLRASRTRGLAVLLLFLLVPILTSGTLMSGTRFLATAFPAFVLLASLGRSHAFDRGYRYAAVALQALFMAAWSQFYWLG